MPFRVGKCESNIFCFSTILFILLFFCYCIPTVKKGTFTLSPKGNMAFERVIDEESKRKKKVSVILAHKIET